MLASSVSNSAGLRPLKLFLNDTWIRHPLRPLLIDLPIGAWTITILLEVIGRCRINSNAWPTASRER